VRQAIENWDRELVLLKGFNGETEFKEATQQNVFKVVEEGNLKGLQEIVEQFDLRVFSRKRSQVPKKLEETFGINPYCAFSPVHAAIMKGHTEIVKFIMDQMKLNLRPTLCLQLFEIEDNFMTDVSQEFQAFPLILACHLQDESLFRYLWETHEHLWSERHIEPLMKQLIESKWIPGIKFLF